MNVEQAETVQYKLAFNTESIEMNPLVGNMVSIHFTGNIFCIKCGKKTNKSFGQGFCYNCFRTAPENSECIIRPELCQAHLGKGRDPEWEERNHNCEHIVYLAATDVIKVGVTNGNQIPTRWIDQGAESAIILCRTPNRYEAGKIEVALKSIFTDRTNWRNMLQNKMDKSIDLSEKKWELEDELPRDITQFFSDDDLIYSFHYPVISYPKNVSSIDLDKQTSIQKRLMGIRGQYLIFEDESVINIRKYSGYQVEIEF